MENVAWRPFATDAVTARTFDDELVVYNEVTGSTHHLSVLGRLVMLAVLAHPCGIALQALVRRVAEDGGVGVDELAQAVERTLVELSELTLVASTT